jgi:atlastin
MFSACETWADGEHPHGKGENLVRIVRKLERAEFHGNMELINKTFLHPDVKERKIVVFSIIGAYRQGKSFFLDYCLRYLYATVSKNY